MKSILRAALMWLSVIPSIMYGYDSAELFIDSGTCWLKERGVAGKKGALSIQGRKTEDGCLAFITDKVFSERYQFCVYSGFEMVAGREAGYYGCSHSREHESYMFRAYMSLEDVKQSSGLTCMFMCFSK